MILFSKLNLTIFKNFIMAKFYYFLINQKIHKNLIQGTCPEIILKISS